ncbi:alpha-tocopherol transfer protein-like isoform X2 [Rhodnius prolixus]|uniref:alpha-tocopherol transfer protein-like isoform X2 n=1 Tax=Rhodnius prolixus TaxID=13249 RepID=UPI003D189D7D
MISTRDEMLLYEKCRKFLQTVHTKEIKEHHSKLEDFKQWCQTQEEIPPTITVQQLVEFLNAVDYNLEKAQELILAHYRLKMQIADILFNQRDPFHSDVQNVWTVIKLATLPKLTQQGFRIVFTGLANTNPKRFNFFATFRLFTMAMEASMMVEGLFPGYAVIGDASGLTFHHIPFSSFGTVKKILQYVQYGLPISVKAIHVLNLSKIGERLYSLIRPLLNHELVEMKVLHLVPMKSGMQFYKIAIVKSENLSHVFINYQSIIGRYSVI